MKKNIVALTALMALSATAQAAGELNLQESAHDLFINGSVTIDGCAFEDGDGKSLMLELNEVSLATVKKDPTTILNSLGATGSNTLVCPPGINSVQLTVEPAVNSFDGDTLLNTAASDAAAGVGFKVAAAFGADLPTSPEWINFATPKPLPATPDANRQIVVNFGANYALTETMADASAGAVEAKLPFKISYM